MGTKYRYPAGKLPISIISSICFGLTALATPSAFAQDDTDSNEGGRVLEEVAVTARKRVEALQDVPIAITAFTEADIEAAGIRDTTDIASMTPGFNVAPLLGGDATTPVIRGLSTTIGEPNVGYFVDGVYIGSRLTMTNLLTPFIERIEIAKGPQSALYGRNTFGGAVNFVTKQPDSQFGGDVEVTVGNYGKYAGRVALSGPLGGDEWSYRIGALYNSFNGYYDNELNGNNLDDRENWGFLGALMYSVDNFNAAFNVVYDKVDNGDEPLKFIENNDVFFPAFGVLPPDYQIYTGTVPNITDGYAVTEGGLERRQTFLSLNLDWDFGAATLNSITGYNDFRHERNVDDDFDPRPIHNATTNTDVSEFSQELRLTSNNEGPWRWMFGLYGYWLNDDTDVNSAYVGPLLPFFGGLYNVTHQKTTDLAAFGSLAYDFNETLSITFSGRYGHEKKKVQAEDTDLKTGGQAVFEDKDSWNAFLPRLAIDWRFNDNNMAYASYALAKKAGGFNVVTATGTILPHERSYDPEKSNNYEIGLKSTLADGRIQTTLALYYIKWKDQIVRAIGESGSLLNTNAGKSTSKGVEFEMMWAATDKLLLRGGVAYNNSKYDEYFFAVLAALGMDPVLDGNTLQYAPKWTGNISATYTQPISGTWDWFTRIDWDYLDEVTLVQTNNAWNDSSNRFNLRTGFQNGNWTITAWAFNLFNDKTTVTGAFIGDPAKTFEFATGQRAGLPIFNANIMAAKLRSYGLTVRYNF